MATETEARLTSMMKRFPPEVRICKIADQRVEVVWHNSIDSHEHKTH